MSDSKEHAILQVAEDMVRQGGYNSFSFRKIADKVGIKSASVHYHFPTKEDLGVAIVKRYTENFIQSIGEPEQLLLAGKNPLKSYIDAFRDALHQDKGMCLCGILGAEAETLPDSVLAQTRLSFTVNIDWLEQAYLCISKTNSPKTQAIQAITLLEGAMVMSNIMGDKSYFDEAASLLLVNQLA